MSEAKQRPVIIVDVDTIDSSGKELDNQQPIPWDNMSSSLVDRDLILCIQTKEFELKTNIKMIQHMDNLINCLKRQLKETKKFSDEILHQENKILEMLKCERYYSGLRGKNSLNI